MFPTTPDYSNPQLLNAIKNAYQKAWDRNWHRIYWMIDLHETVIPSSYTKNVQDGKVMCTPYPGALETMHALIDKPETRIILWSSTPRHEMELMREHWFGMNPEWLAKVHINENPEEIGNEYADFTSKPYFSILLDDKAGFNPSGDWSLIYNTLNLMQPGKFGKGGTDESHSVNRDSADRLAGIIACTG